MCALQSGAYEAATQRLMMSWSLSKLSARGLHGNTEIPTLSL